MMPSGAHVVRAPAPPAPRGDGRRWPAVVALHGFGDDGACWAPFLDAMGVPAGRRWLPNAPGHGGEPLGPDFTHDTLVRAAVLVVEQVAAATGGVALMGHSMGASTAVGVAAARPELVALLVLEDPPWTSPQDPAADAAAERRNEHRPWIEGLQASGPAGRAGWLDRESPHWPVDEREAWSSAKASVDVRLFDQPQHWVRRSWQPLVAAVRCPGLLVIGEPSHGSATAPSVAGAIARAPGWQVLQVAGAGHSVRRDARGVLAGVVAGFLEAR